jgi:phosphatidylglycerophosphatase A
MVGAWHQLVAMVFGVGLIRYAPGTAGSIVGFALFAALQPVPLAARIAIYLLLLIVAVWACEKTGKDLNAPDHGSMVIDETLAVSLVLEFTPADPWSWLLAFLLFRLFDIIKPWPASYVDRHWKGGLFVMLDDLIAALYAVLVIRFVAVPLLLQGS